MIMENTFKKLQPEDDDYLQLQVHHNNATLNTLVEVFRQQVPFSTYENEHKEKIYNGMHRILSKKRVQAYANLVELHNLKKKNN